LYLGRDDDCYNFIKWWETTGKTSGKDNPPKSKEGDWMYLTGQDKLDFLDKPCMELAFTVQL
jgi:hypothetical protein